MLIVLLIIIIIIIIIISIIITSISIIFLIFQEPPPVEVLHLRVVGQDEERAVHLAHGEEALPDARHEDAPVRRGRLGHERLVRGLPDALGPPKRWG